MSHTVHVDLGTRSYDIRIGQGWLGSLGKAARDVAGSANHAFIISDDQVDPLYGPTVEASLASAGFQTARAVVPAGEASKCADQLSRLHQRAAELRLDRKALVVALGGGVIGDLAGFMAATYLRGVRFIQVPTTLLAMVDSAVGGKTGINLPQGKNLVGSFHQPSLVVSDLDVLASLPPRELRSGLAEVIKYGVIADADLFQLLEDQLPALLELDHALVARVIARSCEIKADVVRQDEEEGGLRAILNFGHTLGHALEAVLSYGEWLHGEAIAVGMLFAARVSQRITDFPASDAARLETLIAAVGLPVRAPDCAWSDLRSVMEIDKKSTGGIPAFVLAEAIGKVRYGVAVPEAVLAEVWAEMAL